MLRSRAPSTRPVPGPVSIRRFGRLTGSAHVPRFRLICGLERTRVSLGARRGDPRPARWSICAPGTIAGDRRRPRCGAASRGPRKSASARPGRTPRIAAAAGVFGFTWSTVTTRIFTVAPLTTDRHPRPSSAPIDGEQLKLTRFRGEANTFAAASVVSAVHPVVCAFDGRRAPKISRYRQRPSVAPLGASSAAGGSARPVNPVPSEGEPYRGDSHEAALCKPDFPENGRPAIFARAGPDDGRPVTPPRPSGGAGSS